MRKTVTEKANKKNVINEVYTTTDYDAFKVIDGNRIEVASRVKKIEKSVEEVGYIPAPIIVNEKMEIIDGQARFAYCKKTKTPLAYIIIDNLTIDECIAMNISQTSWSLMDYITSYADRGNENYIRLKEFIEASPFSMKATIWAISSYTSMGTRPNATIREGKAIVSPNTVRDGMNLLEYWLRFSDIKTNRPTEFLMALGYCYKMDEIDNEVLYKRLHAQPRAMMTIASVSDAMDVIETVYNVRNRSHVYIKTLYLQYLDDIRYSHMKEGKEKWEAKELITA